MFKNYLKGIEGIADYPVISLIAFFVFFVSVSAWLIYADKRHIKELSELPLEDRQEKHVKGIDEKKY